MWRWEILRGKLRRVLTAQKHRGDYPEPRALAVPWVIQRRVNLVKLVHCRVPGTSGDSLLSVTRDPLLEAHKCILNIPPLVQRTLQISASDVSQSMPRIYDTGVALRHLAQPRDKMVSLP